MGENNVADLRDHRVFRAVGLNPNTVISGKASALTDEQKLQERLSPEEVKAAVVALQAIEPKSPEEVDEANWQVSMALGWRGEVYFARIHALLNVPEADGRWNVITESGRLRFVYKPPLIEDYNRACDLFLRACAGDDAQKVLSAQHAKLNAFQRLLAVANERDVDVFEIEEEDLKGWERWTDEDGLLHFRKVAS